MGPGQLLLDQVRDILDVDAPRCPEVAVHVKQISVEQLLSLKETQAVPRQSNNRYDEEIWMESAAFILTTCLRKGGDKNTLLHM